MSYLSFTAFKDHRFNLSHHPTLHNELPNYHKNCHLIILSHLNHFVEWMQSYFFAKMIFDVMVNIICKSQLLVVKIQTITSHDNYLQILFLQKLSQKKNKPDLLCPLNLLTCSAIFTRFNQIHTFRYFKSHYHMQ